MSAKTRINRPTTATPRQQHKLAPRPFLHVSNTIVLDEVTRKPKLAFAKGLTYRKG